MDLKVIKICVVAVLILMPTPALYAKTALEQQQQIFQQEQQRQEELRRRIEQQQKRHESFDVAPTPDVKKTGDGPCFNITTIILDGAEQISEQEQQALTAPYLNQCLDLDTINELLKEVSNWYFEKGYITSRAYVSAQDLSDGTLTITVIEGKIEKMEIEDPESRLNLSTAFPSNQSKLFNLRDIEQGLEQINRLQSQQATIDILPGVEPGASVVQLKVNSTKPWAVSLTRDNTGQRSTGELINSVFAGIDNPLGLNDYTYFNWQESDTSAADKDSKSMAWHWDMPYGYWNLAVDVSYFEYLSSVQAVATTFETSGTSLSQQVKVSRTLFRNQDSKLKFHTGLERKKNENFIEDILLDSSRVLGIARLGLEYDKYFANQSQVTLAFDYYRGLSLFGAPKDEDRAESAPKAQFDKFTFGINYFKQWLIAQEGKQAIPLSLQSQLQLQQSSDSLFGTEQISIGSLYTVRGYKENSISAASGAYWRNTLQLHYQTPKADPWLQRVTPFIAFDIGAIRDRDQSYSQDTYTNLMGWSIGTTFSSQYYSINLVYAKPINNPSWLSTPQEE